MGEAVEHGVGHGVGLLVDLLEHEGLEAGLLGGLLVPVDLLDLALDGAAVGVQESAPSGRTATISSFSTSWMRRVSDRKAGIAEAMKCSPSPTPTTSGHSLRAPTSRSGSSARIATNA